MTIIAIYRKSKDKKVKDKLIGYLGVNQSFFDKKYIEDKLTSIPNEFFYRRVYQHLGVHWDTDLVWKSLTPEKVTELKQSYARKVAYNTKHLNRLETLENL